MANDTYANLSSPGHGQRPRSSEQGSADVTAPRSRVPSSRYPPVYKVEGQIFHTAPGHSPSQLDTQKNGFGDRNLIFSHTFIQAIGKTC